MTGIILAARFVLISGSKIILICGCRVKFFVWLFVLRYGYLYTIQYRYFMTEKVKKVNNDMGFITGGISIVGAVFFLVSWLNSPTVKIEQINSDFVQYVEAHERELIRRDKELADHEQVLNDRIKGISNRQDELIADLKDFVKTQNERYEKIITLILDK